jgi:CXXX repeat modification system protein
MGNIIWTLSEEDKKIIEELYEKKVALENLIRIVDPGNEKLYQKMIEDYSKVTAKFNNWWQTTSRLYNWVGQTWSVDFTTGNVFEQKPL